MDTPVPIVSPQSLAQPQLQAHPRLHRHLVPDRPRVHITLQGKGGVGKSLVSLLLAQYLRRSGIALRCIDTDPVNDTFSQFKAIGASHLNLMRDRRVDQGAYDTLFGQILAEPSTFVVDCGA